MPSPAAPCSSPAAVAAARARRLRLGDDGPRTTQTRDVAGFTRIDNRASVDVRLRVGEPQRVRVLRRREGDRRRAHRGARRDAAGDFDHDGFGGDDVVVEASVPELTGIEASGSGDIDADGIDADAFDAPLGRLGRHRARGHRGTARRRPATARATPISPAWRRARRA